MNEVDFSHGYYDRYPWCSLFTVGGIGVQGLAPAKEVLTGTVNTY